MSQRHWVVLRVEPFKLPRVRFLLRDLGEVYAPMGVRRYRIRGKWHSAPYPILHGYAFCDAPADADAWHSIREVQGVLGILTPAGEPYNGVPCSIASEDVEHIRELEASGKYDELKQYMERVKARAEKKKAQKSKTYRLTDLAEVINIMEDNAA